MMVQLESEQETPLEIQLKKLYSEISAEKSPEREILEKWRTKSWERFLDIGLPTRHVEAYNYIRMRALCTQPYVRAEVTQIIPQRIQAAIYPECRHSYLVFVNGHYQQHLSNTEALPKQLVILKLSDAMRTYGALLNNQWAKSIKEEKDAFALLNGALHEEGIFLYLPPKMAVHAPLQIIHAIDTSENPMLLLPRLNLFMGAHAVLSLISTQVVLSGKGYGYGINSLCDITIEEGAHVQFTQTALDGGVDSWHFEALRATLKRNSSLKTVNVTEGSATVRNDYNVILMGENAEAILNGVSMLTGKNEAHSHIVMEHQAPHCRSMQLFKTVVSDSARSSFEGKILVRQLAQKTEAFQLNNNLVLSDHAFAYSKPNLEIFADDVKATHGSTVGQLDPEQLLYLATRGFLKTDAKNLLIYGFCQEVIDKIPLVSLVEAISKRARQFCLKTD